MYNGTCILIKHEKRIYSQNYDPDTTKLTYSALLHKMGIINYVKIYNIFKQSFTKPIHTSHRFSITVSPEQVKFLTVIRDCANYVILIIILLHKR